MKKLTPVLFLSLLASSLLMQAQADDQQKASLIQGEWRCSQLLSPDPQISLQVDYTQLFTTRHFTLDGSMDMQFANNLLKYTVEGSGDWSVRGDQLIISTRNSDVKPGNPMALQLHEAGILDVNQLRNIQSEDVFNILTLNSKEMRLKHSKEDLGTDCVRL